MMPTLLAAGMRLWNALVRPAASVTGAADRRQARLLTALLVVLAPITLGMGVVSARFRPLPMGVREWSVAASLTAAGLGLYVASRTRWFRVAAALLPCVTILGAWAVALTEQAPHRIVASVLLGLVGVIYCSFFWSVTVTVVAAAALTASAALLPFLHPLADGDVMVLPAFLAAMVGSLVVVGTSARQRDLRAMRRQSQQMREMVEKTSDCVAVIRDDTFVYSNPAMITTLGETSQEALRARPVVDWVHPEDRSVLPYLMSAARPADPAGAPFQQTVAAAATDSEHRQPAQLRLVKRDGTLVTLEAFPMARVAFKSTSAFLLIARDVTERNRLQEQLVLAERLASLGTVAAGVAHEINNPLAYVVANMAFVSDSLERLQTSDPPPVRAAVLDPIIDAVREAHEGAQRIRLIARDLGTLSRVDDDRPVAVDLHAAIETAVNMARSEVRRRAAIERVFGDIPPVHGNQARLGQVFLNLLINAAHAIPPGEPEHNTITIRTFTKDSRWAVAEIRDTGAGIPPEELAHVFTPFFTTKPAGKGSGLGLSISLKIIRGLGGDVVVESAVGKGTTVRVQLPLATTPAVEAAPAKPRPPPREGLRILVVDDDAKVANAVKRTLARYDVTIAHTAQAALELCRSQSFDVILCDVVMPEVSGMDFYECLRRDEPGSEKRIVFLTAGVFTPAIREFLAQVDNTRLEKPFDTEALLTVLHEQMQRFAAPPSESSDAS